jgi:hypothetical protein
MQNNSAQTYQSTVQESCISTYEQTYKSIVLIKLRARLTCKTVYRRKAATTVCSLKTARKYPAAWVSGGPAVISEHPSAIFYTLPNEGVNFQILIVKYLTLTHHLMVEIKTVFSVRTSLDAVYTVIFKAHFNIILIYTWILKSGYCFRIFQQKL